MTASKKVLAVDASRMSAERTGIENYLHPLLPHLCRAWALLDTGQHEVKVFATAPAVAAHVFPAPEVLPGGGRGWTQLRLRSALRRIGASVFFNPIPVLPVTGGLPCPLVVLAAPTAALADPGFARRLRLPGHARGAGRGVPGNRPQMRRGARGRQPRCLPPGRRRGRPAAARHPRSAAARGGNGAAAQEL